MNVETVEGIRKALEAATPGSWVEQGWDDNEGDEGWWVTGEQPRGAVAVALPYNTNGENDAHLIANAPSWLAALLDDRDRLLKDVDYWKREAESLSDANVHNAMDRDHAERMATEAVAAAARVQERMEAAESREHQLRAALADSARGFHDLSVVFTQNHAGDFNDCGRPECVRARVALTQEAEGG